MVDAGQPRAGCGVMRVRMRNECGEPLVYHPPPDARTPHQALVAAWKWYRELEHDDGALPPGWARAEVDSYEPGGAA